MRHGGGRTPVRSRGLRGEGGAGRDDDADSLETSGERLQQWLYYNGNGHFPRMTDAHFRMLQIKFDERGVVRSYSSAT